MKLHLVDATYELFRAHFAPRPPVLGRDGVPLSGVSGLVEQLLYLLREEGATHVGCATDRVIESFRNNLYPGYKSSAGMPSELLAQFPVAEAGAAVVATQDWHPPTTPHFAQDGGIWPVHCVAGTWGAELHPALTLPGNAPRVRKGANGEDGYSAFTMRDPTTGETIPTELESLLRNAGVEGVVVVGIATDYCVKATALDALRLGFETAVLTDAVAAVDLEPGDGDRALDEMRDAGVTIDQAVAR